MDLILLIAQVLLVVLLVVIPLFSGYDKWQEWSGRRKVVAVALAIGIAVVAFSQYRRIVTLDKTGIGNAFKPGATHMHGPWFAERVGVSLWEWLATMVAGSVLLALVLEAWRRRKRAQAAGYLALFALMVGLATLLKLRSWSGD